jgi:hypothetical protein
VWARASPIAQLAAPPVGFRIAQLEAPLVGFRIAQLEAPQVGFLIAHSVVLVDVRAASLPVSRVVGGNHTTLVAFAFAKNELPRRIQICLALAPSLRLLNSINCGSLRTIRLTH